MSKKIAYGLMTLSFILIISGGVSSFLLGLQADRNQTFQRIDMVHDEFEIFSTNTSIFEVEREELYTTSLGDLYYDTMFEEDKNVKEKLSNYEHLVDELTKNVKKLDSLCEDVYYPDKEANSQCNNYKSIYEQVVNYFVSDIQVYHKNIEKYNLYQNEIKSPLRLKKYETKKEFIDYNQDKKYDGKEES